MNKKHASVLIALSLSLVFPLLSCNNEPSGKEGASGTGTTTSTTPAKTVKAPDAQGSRRILFVGNSHTEFYTSIPDLFSELCQFNHNDIKVEKVVEMGISLRDIYQDHKDKVSKACTGTDPDGNYYDYVVLQEKTPIAATNATEYNASVKQLMTDIRKNSPGAVFLVYEVMSPADYDKEKNDYQELYQEMKQTAENIAAESSNTRLYRVSEAINAAYEGKNGYVHSEGGKDRLRFGENTLHLLNDGGFLAASLLYASLFDKAPALPEQMSLSTGTGDADQPKLQPIKPAVSNPDALLKIAMEYK